MPAIAIGPFAAAAGAIASVGMKVLRPPAPSTGMIDPGMFDYPFAFVFVFRRVLRPAATPPRSRMEAAMV
ncbi:MAG: hypothetical protein KGL35_27685 [Bradyrhizobium sp.]|nr:hypothetical protein [Bradyrhizobium sp.]